MFLIEGLKQKNRFTINHRFNENNERMANEKTKTQPF